VIRLAWRQPRVAGARTSPLVSTLVSTRVSIVSLVGALLLLSAAPSPALARGHGGSHSSGHSWGGHWGGGHFHHRGGGFGVFFLGPGWGYYPYDYFYYDPWELPDTGYPPEAFVERPDLEEQEARAPHWYYCYDPAGYYPTVAECNGDWTPVAPLPASPSDQTPAASH
jgi:hypothetical protein